MSEASTALAKIDTGAYPVLAGDATEAIAALQENMGGSTISPFDLDVITVPGSGGLSWRVPGLAGETEEKKLEGILIYHRTNRAFWRVSFDESGGGTPPDCASDDGILVQATRDVVALVDGEGIQSVQWDIYGGFSVAFKAFAIQVPLIRSDIEGRSGVFHMS